MIVRRLMAVVIAVSLIGGAVLIRRELERDDPSGPSAGDITMLVCAVELAAACGAVTELPVTIEEAGTTLDRLADADADSTSILWLTFDPFPAMADSLRTAARLPATTFQAEAIASSPIALVAPTSVISTIGETCGTEPTWQCVAGLDLRIGFARTPTSGTGLLGLVQAALGFDPAGSPAFDDAQFQVWLRNLVRSVAPSQLSSGTAIDTLQTRPSSMDVAVGTVAQLGNGRRSDFGVAYAEPMIRADVVLAAPTGAELPDEVARQLREGLVAAGWEEPDPSSSVLDARTVLAVRALWEELR